MKIRGREARPATSFWNVCKTLMQSAVFWLMLLFVVPFLIYKTEDFTFLAEYRFANQYATIAGVVLFIAGGSLGLSSGICMAIYGKGTPLPLDCPRELVIVGPYKYVRNPMAIGGLVQGIAVGIFVGSFAIVLYTLTGLVLWNFWVRKWEEYDLRERFGAPYNHYCQHVICWFPRVTAYRKDLD